MSRRDWRAIRRRARRSSCRLEETGVADCGWESWSSCSRDESCSSPPCGSWRRSRFATLPAISAEIADSLQRIELARVPDVEARALLTSHDAAVRIRAALAVGRIGVAEAAGTLRRMLDDPEAGEMAAWALGRIDGGRDALISCLAERCPASRAA